MAEVMVTGAFWCPTNIFDMFSIPNHLNPILLFSPLVLLSLFAESCELEGTAAEPIEGTLLAN